MRRDSTQVVHNLLTQARARSGITQTQMVHRANLNFYAAHRYLNRLVEENLLRISKTEDLVRYHLTSQGERLLVLLDEVYTLMKIKRSETTITGSS